MGLTLRFRLRQGQRWREQHKLIQVEQRPGHPPSGLENSWTLEQEVLEALPDRCRVSWKREDETSCDQPEGPNRGELWIDELGRSKPVGGQEWSEPLFPVEEVEVSQVWTHSAAPGATPVHFTIEKQEEDALHLVSYLQVTQAGISHEVRGATRMCPDSGRVLSSLTVTKVSHPEGRTVQTVVEVNSEELTSI